ncbi:MAG TPA: hypothetical protein VED37_14620, partial [Ktedonobacteraceae bacterium]|nr:hypothetical protein [Ktedonobacteraceae bacterium]
SHQFQRWIITLGAEVRALHANISDKDAKELKKKLKTYEAELQQLYSYAEQDCIDLITYYYPLVDIEGRLLLIHEFFTLEQDDIV